MSQTTDLSLQAAEVTAAPRHQGIGLCLSGGGFRAALFHLGVLRRLHELGILSQVTTFSSVSGGSIIAAFLADRFARSSQPIATSLADWDATVSRPFRDICRRDLRTVPVLVNCLWDWLFPGPLVRQLERRYRARVTPLLLGQLPPQARFVLCASDLTFGINWEFSLERTGDYQAGYLQARTWPVARAIAASAAFPPLIGPLRLREQASQYSGGHYREKDRARLLTRIDLSDGGVYDNMGLEPVWKDHAVVLVSDCGAPFDLKVGDAPWRRLLRYIAVVTNQTRALRLRKLFGDWSAGHYGGAYWSLVDGVDSAATPARSFDGYSQQLALEVLGNVRTDLDNFSDAEMSVLENHGYYCAERATRRWTPELRHTAAPTKTPYPEWESEPEIRVALRDSARRIVPRRLLAGALIEVKRLFKRT